MISCEVLPSPKVVGDSKLNALCYLGHAIYYWQLTYAGPKPLQSIDPQVYFDTLHILIATYEAVHHETHWETFSPHSLANLKGQT